jgi:hypothetical protein
LKASTHKARVLDRLKQGPATHMELYRLGCVAHSRISDLRKDGWRIDRTVRVENGETLHVYELVGTLGETEGSNEPLRASSGGSVEGGERAGNAALRSVSPSGLAGAGGHLVSSGPLNNAGPASPPTADPAQLSLESAA